MKLTMIGRLDPCVLLAYRTPAESVGHLVPRGLDLVTQDGLAFWNIVICRVIRMRPLGVPAMLGMTYAHVAYRLYVSAQTATGEIVRGLYFVRSDVDRRLMSIGGNVVTDFRFHASDVALRADASRVELEVRDRDGAAQFCAIGGTDALAADSSILKYQPVALSVNADGTSVRMAEVVRNEAEWRETPVIVEKADWSFLTDYLSQNDLHLERATRVAPLPYCWRLGAVRPLTGPMPEYGERSSAPRGRAGRRLVKHHAR